MDSWADRLKSYIKGRRISQATFAEALGVDDGVLNLYLNGQRMPKADFFQKLRAAGVSLDWLFTGEGDPEADRIEPDRVALPAELAAALDAMQKVIDQHRRAGEADGDVSGG